MAACKAGSTSTVLLIWLLLPGKCARQALDELIMDADNIDASKDKIASASNASLSDGKQVALASDMMYGGDGALCVTVGRNFCGGCDRVCCEIKYRPVGRSPMQYQYNCCDGC